jgi:hypothetical protein
VNNLTVTVREAIKLVIPYIKYKNVTFSHWFCNSLKYYIKKKDQHHYSGFVIIANWVEPPLK